MDDKELADLAAVLPPLLQALEALGFVARHLHPPQLPELMAALGRPDAALRADRHRLDGWPEDLADPRDRLAGAADAVLAAFDALREAADARGAYRALRQLPRAQEALYPMAAALPPLNRFFLHPSARGDTALAARLAQAPERPDTGVFHVDNEPGARGGFSLYVPETYDAAAPAPLVVALHGGAGNGRGFLWTWLADARTRGAILVAPTALGDTWALTGADIDSPNLERILDTVRGQWAIDPMRMLLTGMSDGGTFAYVSGLDAASPFTHLAPVSAAFHPMLAQFADAERMAGLPIHIAHGALDWMFDIGMARGAVQALTAAGARVTWREFEDLSHAYPRELNAELLDWLDNP